MKKILLVFCVISVLVLTFLWIKKVNNSLNLYDNQELGFSDEVTPEIDNAAEIILDENTVDSSSEENAVSSTLDIDNNNLPGPDVAQLVNLRGDEATVYKLADGTYMDRIERHYVFNGTDTWTDEHGVEWNEKVY